MYDSSTARTTLRVLDDEPTAELPPGSRLPGTIQSLQWFRDPVRFMERNRARHGKAFSVKLGPLSRCSFIADPSLAWEVLTGDPALMRMGSANGIFRPVLGDRSLFQLACDRLQGFPDNYTRIPWRGKPADACPDGPRYKVLGNSMAVPVMRWIGERIEMVDSLMADLAA